MTYNTQGRSRKAAEPYRTQRRNGRKPNITPQGDMMEIEYVRIESPSVVRWCPPCMEYRVHYPLHNGGLRCCRCLHVRGAQPESARAFTEVEPREPNQATRDEYATQLILE